MYTPSSGFEERVPIAIIRYIAKKNQSSKTDPTKLMVDVSYQFPVTFPFSYADVNYNDIKIPKSIQLSNNDLFSSIKIKIKID